MAKKKQDAQRAGPSKGGGGMAEEKASGGKTQNRKRVGVLPVSDRIARLERDLDRVRAREEARLIRVARKAGLFARRIATSDLAALLTAELDTPTKQSQLTRLESTMKKLRNNQSAEARRDDARRKILLGSFLIARFEHDPALLAEMQPELERFLDQHRDAGVAAANKALLAAWLAEGAGRAPEAGGV